MSAMVQPANKVIRYSIGPNCKITLGGEQATFGDLHNSDTVQIVHTAVDEVNPEPLSVSAQRPADGTRRAIVVGNQNYDSRSVTRPAFAAEDAIKVRDTLMGRYQVQPGLVLPLIDENRARLEQSIPEFLGRIGPDGSLIFFFTGRAYKGEDGKAYLALKDFDPGHIAETGLALQWLVDALEKCPAKEKLLVLDCRHAGSGADLAMEPTSEEMFASLAHLPNRGPLKTVTAIASCMRGQRSADLSEKKHGAFGWLLAEGYRATPTKITTIGSSRRNCSDICKNNWRRHRRATEASSADAEAYLARREADAAFGSRQGGHSQVDGHVAQKQVKGKEVEADSKAAERAARGSPNRNSSGVCCC